MPRKAQELKVVCVNRPNLYLMWSAWEDVLSEHYGMKLKANAVPPTGYRYNPKTREYETDENKPSLI